MQQDNEDLKEEGTVDQKSEDVGIITTLYEFVKDLVRTQMPLSMEARKVLAKDFWELV